MESEIRINVVYVRDDLIQIRVFGWNGAFGGTSDIYVGTDHMGKIANLLRGFPNSTSDNREIMLGAFGPDGAGGARMRFYCADSAGHTFVDLTIESGTLSSQHVQSVKLILPIEASAVAQFINDLNRLDYSKNGTARLQGVPTAADFSNLV